MITECPKEGCDAEIQASVPCWLTLGPDGKWEISGFGDEDATFYCAEDHPAHIQSDDLLESMSAFLETVQQGSTWGRKRPEKTPDLNTRPDRKTPRLREATLTLYGMSARTETHNGDYTGMIESPTFYLDSNIQGILSEEHAKRIIEHWLTDAGLTVLGVTAVVIDDSSITTRPEEAPCPPP